MGWGSTRSWLKRKKGHVSGGGITADPGNYISNIKEIGDTGLIIFGIDDKDFWARLTATGRLKRNSIRIDNF